MAIKIVANISKKVPISGLDFSSVQSSCSIEGEVTDLARVADEIRRLYDIAERAVDAQLGLGTPASSPANAQAQPPSSNTAPVAHPAAGARPSGRRGPAPISPAQSRYLGQLLDRSPGALGQILADHRIASIEQLSSRDASTVIDRILKGASA